MNARADADRCDAHEPAFRGASRSALRTAPADRKPSTVTLRLTAEERGRLESLAAGMTFSAYIRACVFHGDETRRRKRQARRLVADRQAIWQVIGLLGQSRIANNLSQLAYQANIGALAMDDQAVARSRPPPENIIVTVADPGEDVTVAVVGFRVGPNGAQYLVKLPTTASRIDDVSAGKALPNCPAKDMHWITSCHGQPERRD